ncbi:hypothetical protein FDP41_001222 [Naegleria fowleri]|uniref:Uncharacterized protein n=1 Tax=Naegleria fowleri TaxID=5763 RepID=A0A6A5C444_NAEFO|nr:uncharacterized protein FDP41_001222 [Naegleria fowleri]KAF0980069.1 hypothetical protein FDP41_001222 [Naegleria fowleri]
MIILRRKKILTLHFIVFCSIFISLSAWIHSVSIGTPNVTTHEEAVHELMSLIQRHQWNSTQRLMADSFRLQVYGFIKNQEIPFSGLYLGKNSWKYFYGNLSKYFDVGKYTLEHYEIVARNGNSSFVKVDETHFTLYHQFKVSLSDAFYLESEEFHTLGNNGKTATTLFTFAQMYADTSSIANVLYLDSGKSDEVLFFVIGSACGALILGIALGSSTLLIISEMKKRIKFITTTKRNSKNPHLLNNTPSNSKAQKEQ